LDATNIKVDVKVGTVDNPIAIVLNDFRRAAGQLIIRIGAIR